MRRGILLSVAAALLPLASAVAGTVNVAVTNDGRPVENAVVELEPGSAVSATAMNVAAEAVVDQRKETFLPLVSVIRKGGRIVFTNNDTTMHQVYSFSDIKQFAFEVDEGQRSQPVVFDKPGVAAIGCNIHDQMITYVYVAASPWAVRTDSSGRALILDVPNGTYRASVWHPQLAPGQKPEPVTLVASGASTKLNLAVALSAADPRGKKHAHSQMY